MMAAVVGGSALSATPASAATSDGYVSGSGDWSNDWWDEGPISESSHAHSNAAAMWQAILWADGQLTSSSGIDCQFGFNTYYGTRAWQGKFGVPVDGVVGPTTLKKASTALTQDFTSQFTYHGYAYGRYVTFTRNSDGQWGMYVGNDHHLLSYDYANFDACS